MFSKETLEDVDAESLPNPREAGVIWQGLVQGVAQVPAMREIEAGGCDELALGADALEEHHQLQLEEDDRVDRGAAAVGIEFLHPPAHKAQVEPCLHVPVEVIGRDEVLQRDGDRCVEAAGLGGTEHGALRGRDRRGTNSYSARRMAITGGVTAQASPASERPAPPRSAPGRATR
jgi:hypothetical protein